MNRGPSGKPRLALIAGPTASGKSALALTLAERTGGVIINADASQVYRDLRILTARPSLKEEARADHRLFGTVDAAEPWSAVRWAEDAKSAIASAHTDGRLPILVGGTGLYIRTLLDGIAPVPPIDPDIRVAVRALPPGEARLGLEREDPRAALRLHPADAARTARALEVVRSTGQTLAAWQEQRAGGIADDVDLSAVVLLPPRLELYGRCDRRMEEMIAQGALEEVRLLLARGLDPALPAMRSIGVRELGSALAGECEVAEAIAAAQRATRRYAKRQYTWFSHQTPSAWARIGTADVVSLAQFET